MRNIRVPVTTRNCRGLPLSATMMDASARSTNPTGPPSLFARLYTTSTPGVVATNQRFCHLLKLFNHRLTYPSGGSDCSPNGALGLRYLRRRGSMMPYRLAPFPGLAACWGDDAPTQPSVWTPRFRWGDVGLNFSSMAGALSMLSFRVMSFTPCFIFCQGACIFPSAVDDETVPSAVRVGLGGGTADEEKTFVRVEPSLFPGTS